MVTRLKIVLPQSEYSALLRLAESNLRSTPEQARYVLRQELERAGLLGTAAKGEQAKDGEHVTA